MRKVFNLTLSILLILCMLFVFTACGVMDEEEEEGTEEVRTYEIRCSSGYPSEHIDCSSMQEVADNVYEKTNGAVKITIYPSNQLGEASHVYEDIMKGKVEMMADTVPSTFDQRLEMLNMPYITTSYDESKVKFSSGSVFFDSYNEIQEELGVETLGMFVDGFMGVAATKHIVDPMSAGKTHSELMRVPDSDAYKWIAESMGYSTKVIPYAELHSALMQGDTDGWFGGSAYMNYESFRDVIAFYSDSKYLCKVTPVVINKEFFESLPEEYQQIIREEVAAASERIVDTQKAQNDQAIADMADMGIEIYECTDEEIEGMAGYIKENVWPRFEDVIGTDLLEVLRNAE